MSSVQSGSDRLEPKTRAFYAKVLTALNEAKLPFLVGGTYALEHYTGIAPNTKDLDLFIRPQHRDRAFEVLAATGCRIQLSSPHWLGKAFWQEDVVDLIFNASNGTHPVDEDWFARAVKAEIFGLPVLLCSPEEMIRSKAFVMERDRWDGADVAHLLHACGEQLDWPYLVRRFGSHWRILLAHLVLFGFIYPSERSALPGRTGPSRIPHWVMQELVHRLQIEIDSPSPQEKICQGTLLSGAQYKVDIERWGYRDARLIPWGQMTHQEIDQWTSALLEDS